MWTCNDFHMLINSNQLRTKQERQGLDVLVLLRQENCLIITCSVTCFMQAMCTNDYYIHAVWNRLNIVLTEQQNCIWSIKAPHMRLTVSCNVFIVLHNIFHRAPRGQDHYMKSSHDDLQVEKKKIERCTEPEDISLPVQSNTQCTLATKDNLDRVAYSVRGYI